MASSPSSTRNLGAERRELLKRWVCEEGRVLAADAARRLGVSLDTVRRDLQELEAAGALRRVHGGALPPGSPGPPGFLERLDDDRDAKEAVARAAVGLVAPGEVIVLSGGVTALAFARALPMDLEATVLSTSPDIAVALADHPHLTVDLVGGRLHPRSRTVVGAPTVAALRTVRPDVCVMSACSLHPSEGLTLRHREEAEVARTMVEQAGRLVSLTTAAKLGSAGPYVIAPAERIDLLVSDGTDDALAPYADIGIDVVRA
jgi:DeoR/GlpR family transcriptional regulator of sugar metabolism